MAAFGRTAEGLTYPAWTSPRTPVTLPPPSAVLRAQAQGFLLSLKPPAEVLGGHASFLHRNDCTARFIHHGTSITAAAINTAELPCSGGVDPGFCASRSASPQKSPLTCATQFPGSITQNQPGECRGAARLWHTQCRLA
jgi:hypothetical protein